MVDLQPVLVSAGIFIYFYSNLLIWNLIKKGNCKKHDWISVFSWGFFLVHRPTAKVSFKEQQIANHKNILLYINQLFFTFPIHFRLLCFVFFFYVELQSLANTQNYIALLQFLRKIKLQFLITNFQVIAKLFGVMLLFYGNYSQ